MPDNNYTGETTVAIGGHTYTMQFTWKVIAELQSRFGDNVFDDLDNPPHVAELVAAGLAARHPEMTAAEVMRLSPPFYPTVDRLVIALNRANHGRAEGVRRDRPFGKLLSRLVKPFRWLWRRRSGPGIMPSGTARPMSRS